MEIFDKKGRKSGHFPISIEEEKEFHEYSKKMKSILSKFQKAYR